MLIKTIYALLVLAAFLFYARGISYAGEVNDNRRNAIAKLKTRHPRTIIYDPKTYKIIYAQKYAVADNKKLYNTQNLYNNDIFPDKQKQSKRNNKKQVKFSPDYEIDSDLLLKREPDERLSDLQFFPKATPEPGKHPMIEEVEE